MTLSTGHPWNRLSPVKAAAWSPLLPGKQGSPAGFCTHRITAFVLDLKAAWGPGQAKNWEAHIQDIAGSSFFE